MSKEKGNISNFKNEMLSNNVGVENCKQCKDCIFQDERGHDRSVCMIYENPGHKPLRVINNTGICEYFNKD